MIVGNRELIGQAIANLVDNALKYGAAPEGGGAENDVAVTARREGGDIVIEVADHGPGVAEADRGACSIVSCGWRARARAPAPGSACRSPPPRRACMAASCGSKTTRPGLKVVVALPVEAASPALLAARRAARPLA